MSEAIIVALITGACGVAVQLIISRRSSNELYAKLDKQSELSDARMQGEIDVIKADIRTLSNRVEAHNKLVERTYELERRADVQEEQIKVANHRIGDLEKKGD